jgi:hypothetical protein
VVDQRKVKYSQVLKLVIADIRRDMPKTWIIDWIIAEYNYDISTARRIIRTALSSVSDTERETFLQSELVRAEKEKILRRENQRLAIIEARRQLERERLLKVGRPRLIE